ncbi:MAG: thioredoxin domain-containing protein [Porphyromonas sp.]|nr:thioredoxin domain-containing protein [Porphyromonas sp.]
MASKNKKILREVGFFVAMLFVAGLISGFVDLSPAKTKSKAEAKVVEISADEFAQFVYDYKTGGDWKYLGDKPAVVDFYADWCPPCRRLRPRLETLAAEYGEDIIVYSVDTDSAQQLSAVLGVRSLPTLFFIPKEGMPTVKVGLMTLNQLRRQVDSLLLGRED